MPPGRAGRLWLTRRLAVARRGADLLDRKLRILLSETARLRDAAARTATEWADVTLALEEQELADSVRLRLAAGRTTAPRRAGPAPAGGRVSALVPDHRDE